MKDLRSGSITATAGFSNEDIVKAVKAKLTQSDHNSKDAVPKNF